MKKTIDRFQLFLISAVFPIARKETTKGRWDLGFLDRLVLRIPDGGHRVARLRSADSGSSLIGGYIMYAKAQSVMQRLRKRRLAVAISIIVLATIPALPMAVQAAAPSKPDAPTLTSGNASLDVSWTAPSSTPAIDSYDVDYKKSTDSDWSDHGLSGLTTSTTIPNLTNGTAYQVRVRASNDNGTSWSDWSNSATGTPGTPHRPMNVSTTAGYREFTVTWSKPTTGVAPTSYEIKFNHNESGNFTGWGPYYEISTSTASTVSVTFKEDLTVKNSTTHDVVADTSYRFQMIAKNSHGESPHHENDGSAPWFSTVTTGVETLTASNLEATTATLTLEHDGTAWSYRQTGPQNNPGTCHSVAANTKTKDLTGLWRNTNLTFTAYSGGSCSTELASETFLTKPGKAAKPVSTSGQGSGILTLTLQSFGNGVLTWYYQYQQKGPSDTDFGSWTTWNKITSGLITGTGGYYYYHVTGLTNGTKYKFRVKTSNATGDGTESDPSDEKTPLEEELNAYNLQATTAEVELLNWGGTMRLKRTAPLPEGVCLAPTKGDNWELSNLSSNTNYTYTAYSDENCSTVLNNKSVSFLTKPGKPTTPIVATGAGRGKLTISASVTGEGTLTKWQYQHKATSDSGFSAWKDISPYTSTSMTYTVTGLAGGESYQFNVRAWNATGSGAASDNSALTELVLLQPSAWLAHFGSAVSAGVTDMIADRIDQSATHGSNLTIVGQPVNLDDRSSNSSARYHGTAFGRHRAGPSRVFDHHSRTEDDNIALRGMTSSELVASSSFSLNSSEGNGEASDGSWTTWGGGRFSSFESGGDDKTDGDLTMAMVGTDYESEGLLLGLGLSHARGDGSYQDKDYRVEVDSTVTGVHPYLRYTVNDQLSVWGTVGFGDGELELRTPVDVERVGSDFRMKTGAVGVRQELESVNETDLTLRSDYLVTRIDSNRTDAVYAVSVRTSRFRLMLGAARDYAMDGGVFRPSVDVVLRQDRGDASVGTGVGVMGNFRFTYPARRLTLELDVQGLATHEQADAEDWSVGGLIQIDQDRFGHGLSLSIRPSLGTDIDSADRVWQTRKVSDLTDEDDTDPAFSISTEVGYGMDALGGLLTLYTGLSDTEGENQVHRLGGRFSRGSRLSSSLEVFNDGDSNSGVALTGSVVW